MNLSRHSLPALSYLLRHSERWPASFEWDYGHTAGCAMGLANQFWGLGMARKFRDMYADGSPALNDMSNTFSMALEAATDMFGGSYDVASTEVTPVMVADKIDKYLELNPV